MPGLSDYVKALDSYSGKLEDYIEGRIPLDFKVPAGVKVLEPLIPLKDELLKFKIESPAVPVPVTIKGIDFQTILEEIKKEIDAEYKSIGDPELTSANEFLIWAHAQSRAAVSNITTIDEALDWNGFLKPLCGYAFLHVVGDKPVYCRCATCQQSQQEPPCYSGKVPQNLSECEDIKHVLGRLMIPYEAGLYVVSDVSTMIKARNALQILRSHNYVIDPEDLWLRRAWTCGVLAIELAKRLYPE